MTCPCTGVEREPIEGSAREMIEVKSDARWS